MFQSSDLNSSYEFLCEKCNYVTSRKSQYERHLLTNKHNNETILKPKSSKEFPCECGSIFYSRTTLWRHKKKCYNNTNKPINETIDKDELIIQLLKQNAELVEVLKNGTHNTNNSHNNNNMDYNLYHFHFHIYIDISHHHHNNNYY